MLADEQITREIVWTGAAVGLVMAYFARPVVDIVDPFGLASAGMLLALACGLLFMTATDRPASARVWIYTSLMFLTACGPMVWAVVDAESDYRKTEKICRDVQTMMLDETTGRKDLPAVFTALKCRVQP